MIKKAIYLMFAIPASYLGYCAIRGGIFGWMHGESSEEAAYRIATFRKNLIV